MQNNWHKVIVTTVSNETWVDFEGPRSACEEWVASEPHWAGFGYSYEIAPAD